MRAPPPTPTRRANTPAPCQNWRDWYVLVCSLQRVAGTHSSLAGYIGGDAFHALYEAHPDFEYTLLVRSSERAEAVHQKYGDAGKVRIVYPGGAGPSMSLTDLLEEEAKKTDIVLRTSSGPRPNTISIWRLVLNGTHRHGRICR